MGSYIEFKIKKSEMSKLEEVNRHLDSMRTEMVEKCGRLPVYFQERSEGRPGNDAFKISSSQPEEDDALIEIFGRLRKKFGEVFTFSNIDDLDTRGFTKEEIETFCGWKRFKSAKRREQLREKRYQDSIDEAMAKKQEEITGAVTWVKVKDNSNKETKVGLLYGSVKFPQFLRIESPLKEFDGWIGQRFQTKDGYEIILMPLIPFGGYSTWTAIEHIGTLFGLYNILESPMAIMKRIYKNFLPKKKRIFKPMKEINKLKGSSGKFYGLAIYQQLIKPEFLTA